MVHNSRGGHGSRRLALRQNVGAGVGISASHQLLSNSRRAAAVEKLESAISWFEADTDLGINCEVALFEMPGDEQLHCNVTHRYATKSVAGWAGPGRVAGGFVHNRRFGDAPHQDVVGHIRDMVFAARA
jgi:hypothetical protein